jgi:DNA-directed RNA polymerase specialized sigma24 family protein
VLDLAAPQGPAEDVGVDTHPRLEDHAQDPAKTLGDVLYARPGSPVAPEGEWSDLVRRTASGELAALHGLYARAGRLVFVLALRIAGSRRAAEDVTVEVFGDLWRRAWNYDPTAGTVLAWIMNQARTRAREQARFAALRREEAAGTGVGSSDALAPNPSTQSRLARRITDLEDMEPTPPPGSELL